MKRYLYLGLLGSLMICSTAATALDVGSEVQSHGITAAKWREIQAERFQTLFSAIGSLPAVPAATVALSAADIEAMAERNATAGSGAPPLVGVVKPVDLDFDLSDLRPRTLSPQPRSLMQGIARRTEDNTVAWAVRLDARNAGGVRLHLTDVELPEGVELYLYNAEGDVRGPYRGSSESLWTHSISGDTLYLQLHQHPAKAAPLSEKRFRLAAALLLDPSPMAFCPDNAPCIEDGSCFDTSDWPAIDEARRAIANILFVQGPFAYICTGGLVTDTDLETTIPYFLTANHCLSTASVAATVETRFQFQTSTCGGACFFPDSPTTLGASLLSTDSANDHTLLRLDEDPPANSIYLGWTTTPVANANGEPLYRLSHPNGSPQAYTTHAVDVNAPTCRGYSRGPFIYSRDQIGATEGGSSGSPVLNFDGKVVGQLFGACGTNLDDVCDAENNATVDGAFADYFADVAEWLDPDGDPGTCPSTALVADEPDTRIWLDLLYAVRDGVLPQEPAGDWMRTAYENHGAEVTRILVMNSALRREAMAVLRLVRPALAAAVADGGLVLSPSERAAILVFTAALREKASPALVEDLDRFTLLLGRG